MIDIADTGLDPDDIREALGGDSLEALLAALDDRGHYNYESSARTFREALARAREIKRERTVWPTASVCGIVCALDAKKTTAVCAVYRGEHAEHTKIVATKSLVRESELTGPRVTIELVHRRDDTDVRISATGDDIEAAAKMLRLSIHGISSALAPLTRG